MKQAEIIKHLSDRQLLTQLVVSQIILFCIGIVSSLFLFSNFSDWLTYFRFDFYEITYYGIFPSVLIVTLNLIIVFYVPKRLYDDGGINERIFKNRTVIEVIVIALIVAIAEEVVFRGLIQTTFGYFVASITFALIHVRYLKKPVLFVSVLLASFYIGYLFVLTENLVVTITIHFIVDFLLGMVIRTQK
ncbi:lysostaphin resistance A-like protein [Virgibacillus sp. W0430]|uniref:CPBP family intramembrane glutamic endopeptidase n=1 Tax=Virgibacillus sp. W0430 TaxID=3391580 RepID=UPI003F47C9E7